MPEITPQEAEMNQIAAQMAVTDEGVPAVMLTRQEAIARGGRFKLFNPDDHDAGDNCWMGSLEDYHQVESEEAACIVTMDELVESENTMNREHPIRPSWRFVPVEEVASVPEPAPVAVPAETQYRIVPIGELQLMPPETRFRLKADHCTKYASRDWPRGWAHTDRDDAVVLTVENAIFNNYQDIELSSTMGWLFEVEEAPEPPQSLPRIVERIITAEQAQHVILARHCLLSKEGNYWDAAGQFGDIANAKRFTVSEVCQGIPGIDKIELLAPIGCYDGGPDMEVEITHAETQRLTGNERFRVRLLQPDQRTGYVYAGMNQLVAKKEAVLYSRQELHFVFGEYPKKDIIIEQVKPCKLSVIKDFFNADVVQLLKACPQNEQVRAFVMSKLKQAPPKECQTFEQLRDWVEFSFTRPRTLKRWGVSSEPPKPVPLLNFEYRGTRTETGICSYSEQSSFKEEATFNLEELKTLIEEAADMGELMDNIDNSARNDLEENWEGDDDISHSDYEQQNVANVEIGPANTTSQMERMLKEYLRQHAPELLTYIDDNY